VFPLLEERQKPPPDLVRVHAAESKERLPSWPRRPQTYAISVLTGEEVPLDSQVRPAKVCIRVWLGQFHACWTDDLPEMLLAEKLVGEARTRRASRMNPRERTVLAVSGFCFMAAAISIAFLLPSHRELNVPVLVGLILTYALVERVRFEFGGSYGTAEQLVVVPIVLLAPLPLVPLLIALANLAGSIPEIWQRSWHPQRLTGRLADCWFCLPPVLVLAALAPGEAQIEHTLIYALAFAAQLTGDLAWTLLRDRLLDRVPMRELIHGWIGTARVDAIFTPIAYMITLAAIESPLALLSILPLTWLLHSFARDREERYAKTLELHRAYRGTVMLLSDVVEFDDNYTAQHSRSVVELANAVANELGVDPGDRQELEFAAMLHDVGKITIPKEILNKPSSLTEEEFELMKQHTIEGQFMLDRIGGLLGRVGEIVRSCHERWDGAGYPDGLRGEQIPYAARIVFCCDAYHAMTSDRVYRSAMSKQEAIAELVTNAGTQFDPAIVLALAHVVQHGEPMVGAADEVRAVLAGAPVRPELSAGAPS
jgi:HD-GYP domain-containing protein (c-di-GMP phosphodiesterase class II)